MKSEKSFNQLAFVKSYFADNLTYFPKKSQRDSKAREEFGYMKGQKNLKDELYILDIIRQELKNESIQRIIH